MDATQEKPKTRPDQVIDVAKMPVDEAVQKLINHAVHMPASDLFFTSNEEHVGVLVRHFGMIKPISILPEDFGRKCLSHIKAVAGIDVAEKRRPADGRWIYEADDGESVDLRINVIPTVHGEDFAIRLLARGRMFTLDHLGMTPKQLEQINTMISSPAG